MFGYEPRPTAGERTVAFATREKALLDLLYLYPFYNNVDELANLRLDQDTLEAEVSRETLRGYAVRFRCGAVERRLRLLLEVYGL